MTPLGSVNSLQYVVKLEPCEHQTTAPLQSVRYKQHPHNSKALWVMSCFTCTHTPPKTLKGHNAKAMSYISLGKITHNKKCIKEYFIRIDHLSNLLFYRFVVSKSFPRKLLGKNDLIRGVGINHKNKRALTCIQG